MISLQRVTRIYLDELEASPDKLGIKVLRLIIAQEELVLEKAQRLIRESRRQLTDRNVQQNFLDLLEIIIVYKLPNLSREEIAAMFGLDELKQTRFYQDVKAQGLAEEAKALVSRLFKGKFPDLSEEIENQIQQLAVHQLEDLGEALLDLSTVTNLLNWLTR